MPIRNVLDNLLNHAVKTGILRILCERDIGWTGRKLAKELFVSPTTANKFLKGLAKDGIIDIKNAGNSYLYSINRDNHAVRSILRPFFEKEREVYDNALSLIRKSLSRCDATILSAAIFGSVATNEEISGSDIDLVVVIENLKDKKTVERGLDDIARIMAQRFQTAVSPYIITGSQFRKKHMAKDSLISEILKSYILIYGKPIERIII
ncbi:MAG: nucleotidyltransferase domain-containing protein [Candidatus Omnitrophica bacterium]|nr:nucleotidyltransferase domain-containing protein [Candidatus Omnitrophota bacterium]